MLQPLSSLFGQVCEFLWEIVSGVCCSAGTLARTVALSHVPFRAGGKWTRSHGLGAVLLLPCGFGQVVPVLEEHQGAQISAKIRPCHSSHFPSSFSLFISQRGWVKGSSLKLQRVDLRNKFYIKKQLILYIAGDNCFLGASYIELY